MQEIEQLLNILQAISSKNFLGNGMQKSKSLEGLYLSGILQGEYKSDIDAAIKLYGTDQSDVRYKMLKHRTKKKLYNALITIDITSEKVLLKKETECSRLLLMAKLLLRQTEFEMALSLSKKARAIAMELEYNDLVLNGIDIELACLADQGILKGFKISKEEYSKFSRIVALEKEAASMFQLSKLYLKSTVKNRKAYLIELPSIIERLRSIWIDVASFSCFYYFYRTSILYYELIGNFEEIIKVTEEAEELVRTNRLNKMRFNVQLNAFMLIYAHLRTKEYKKGLEYADRFQDHLDAYSRNWFSFMENYFLLALHAKQYNLASLLLNRVRSNSSFNTILKDARERWQLYTAYLYFVEPTLSSVENFNYQKFITSITEYSKDKQGYNVAILILQFLYFLKKGDKEGLLYRIESLKKYILTHLNDSFSLRSKLFLKLLMLTVTEDYDATSCRIKGARHYQKLIETPTPGDAYAEIEIVPYEHLWELILEEMPK